MDIEQLKNQINFIAAEHGKVDVIKLAEKLGLKVFLAEDGEADFNAEIAYDDDASEFEILVNAKHSYTRQRFSIAHEIAHYILHRDKVIAEKKIARGAKHEANYHTEKEADKLAEEILMPEILVKQYAEELQLDSKDELDSDIIRSFAQRFEVSPMMAAIRLRNLDYIVSLSYVA